MSIVTYVMLLINKKQPHFKMNYLIIISQLRTGNHKGIYSKDVDEETFFG